MNHDLRYGKFTSSEIGKLMTYPKSGNGFGEKAMTYIKSRGMERRLGRTIGNDFSTKETSWGLLCEVYVFNELLGTDYRLSSQETTAHPDYPFWVGSVDGERFIEEKTCFDMKAPFTLLSFCTLIDAFNAGGIEGIVKEHTSGREYKWQLVSNGILTKSSHAELIVFVPYKRELDQLRQLAYQAPPELRSALNWLDYTSDDQLPHLIEGKGYKNANILRWRIAQEDKDALTQRVPEAEKILSPNILLAQSEPGVTLIQKA